MIKECIWKDNRIRYKDEGTGSILILIHGFAESLDIWEVLSAKLSSHFRVISMDLPGCSQSECHQDSPSIEDFAECVETLLPPNEKALVVGHSMGGYVALAFAEMFAHRMAGLVLFHSSALADSDAKQADRLRAAEVARQNKQEFLFNLVPKLFAPMNRIGMVEEVESVKKIGMQTNSKGIVNCLMAMKNRPDRRAVLKKIKCPVLFFMGKYDELIPVEVMLTQTFLPSFVITSNFLNSGHMGFIEEPEESFIGLSTFAKLCYRI